MAGMQQPFGRVGSPGGGGPSGRQVTIGIRAAVPVPQQSHYGDSVAIPRSHRSLCLARDLTVMSPGQRMSTGYRSVSSAGRAPVRGCRDPRSQSAMGLIGTAVSGVFLVAIGLVNFLVLARIAAVVHRMRKGLYDEAELEAQRDRRALLNRLLRPVKKTVRKPRHMY